MELPLIHPNHFQILKQQILTSAVENPDPPFSSAQTHAPLSSYKIDCLPLALKKPHLHSCHGAKHQASRSIHQQ